MTTRCRSCGNLSVNHTGRCARCGETNHAPEPRPAPLLDRILPVAVVVLSVLAVAAWYILQ